MADLSITAANVQPVAGYASGDGTAGETITAGQSVFSDANDGNKLKLAIKDQGQDAATVVGISTHGASRDQPLRYITSGSIDMGATLVVGMPYTVGAARGGVAQIDDLSSGDISGLVGVASATDNLKVFVHVCKAARA